MSELLEYFTNRTEDMVDLLVQMVEMESPTTDKEAVDRLGSFIAEKLAEVGASVTFARRQVVGDQLIARWGEGAGQALLLTHRDTVWPIGAVAERPVRREEGRLYGPGAFDMKGGIVIALFALQAMRDLGRRPRHSVVLLCTSDEEIGSLYSRDLIEEEARKSVYALVLEPAQPPDAAVKTARKGVGRFVLTVRGKASHSGVAPQEGISAIEELAHQILALHRLTDHQAGTTVNVGVIQGGIRPNIVAPQARAEIDLRVASQEEGDRVVQQILALKPHLPGAEVEVAGGLTRPPMPRTPAIAALFEQARALARGLGMDLREASSGGGSDGNFTAALGIPTLDGLGVVGDGAHAVHEHVLIESLPQRAALLVRLLENLE